MNFENIKSCVFEAARDAGIGEYEIFYTSDSSVSAETLKDEISAFTYGVSGGICFRCVVDGKMGCAATELLDEHELRAIVARAVSNAKNIESDDPAIIFEGSEKYEKLTVKAFEMPAASKQSHLTVLPDCVVRLFGQLQVRNLHVVLCPVSD